MVTSRNNNVYFGLSTDTKPIALVPNGSMFICMDTKEIYLFDKANATWRLWG